MTPLWQQNISLPTFPTLDHDLTTDVLIIGGGLAGILCAHRLAQAGVDYALIEADHICRGVTANTTAKITAQHGLIYFKLLQSFGPEQAKLYLQANEAAINEYDRLCRHIPCDFEEQDNFVYELHDPYKLEQEMKALEQIGCAAEYVTSLPLPFPIAGAIKFPHQGQFHPLKFVAGLADGLNVFEHTTARAYDGEKIQTDRHSIWARKIIVTTHFPLFNKHGSYFIKLYQHRSYVLGLEGGPNVEGMYVDNDKNGLSFRSHKDLLLLGGGSHRTGKQGGGWTELEAFAQHHYPAAQIKYRWATQDCMSLDGVPYIGQYAKTTPNLLVATGFNKWGITSSMVAATLLSDLICGKENPYTVLFSPSRSVLHPQLALNALESTRNLLTPTRPRCPHMGCALKWNAQEKSWDCPCHGSRFTKEGKLLDNPATDDMKR